jgi:hypothetical protein
MQASVWVPLLVGMMVFASLVALSVATAGYLVWRYGRRRWRMLHSHHAVVTAGMLWTAFSSRYARRGPARSAADMHDWPARTVRREMWRTVDRAELAVRTADDLGGPTVSLLSLCRRLRHAAIAVDRVLRVDPDRATSSTVAVQAFDVMQAAGDIQRAAVASAGHATGLHVDALTRDADQELLAFDAGLDSTRALTPEPEV